MAIPPPELRRPQRSLRPVPLDAHAPAWRLTERGAAVVVVAGLAIALAALTVIGLTAIRVTSASYLPAGSSVVVSGMG